MHHFFSIAFSLLAIIGQHVSVQTIEKRSERRCRYKSLLTVPNGGRWGTLRTGTFCPDGTYAIGFSLRVEKPIGDGGDDTALNGIRLYCADRPKEGLSSVQSETGYWGEWTGIEWCPSGYLKAFQLRVESPQGGGDDTAANNIRFKCSDGSVLEGEGAPWGDWGDWSPTCEGTGIYGITSKIEEKQGNGDDTALNDVWMHCC